MPDEQTNTANAASLCELGGCKFLPLCEACEQAEIIAATKHLTDPSVCSPLAERWGTVTLSGGGEVGVRGELPPPEIEAYIEQVLADVSGGSSSSLTPGAGDATQGAKDGEPGTPSDSPPPTAAYPQGFRLPDTREGDLPSDIAPGAYWKVLDDDGTPKIKTHPGKLTEECWRAVVPVGDKGGFGIANLYNHTVREEDDGSISVRPGDGSSNSILVQKGAGGPSWHGYIERGVFREA